jgi:hypothetical protein
MRRTFVVPAWNYQEKPPKVKSKEGMEKEKWKRPPKLCIVRK